MKRSLSAALIAVLLLSGLIGLGCALTTTAQADRITTMIENMQQHGHARYSIIDRHALGIILLCLVAESLPRAGDVPADLQDQREWTAPASPEPTKEPATLRITPSVANPFFDHELDGLWHGRTTVSFDGGWGKLPFLLLANASDGWVYLSVVFQDINGCVHTGKADWTAVYTDKVETDPGSTEFRFERVASEFLAPFVPEILNLDFSYTSHVRKDQFWGQGTARVPNRSRVVFTTVDEFLKVKKTGGVRGLWSSGFNARVYAGELQEPPIFHPTALSLMNRPNQLDMDLSVLWGTQEDINAEVNGKRLTFDFWTPNGVVDGDFTLQGGRLVGRVWDPLSVGYLDLVFKPAGTDGRTPKLKRVKPKALALSTPGKTAKLTVIGRDFVPGTMVFFDNSDIELKSVEFLNKKKLKVKVASVEGIERGETVDVMVLNPDNRSAKKAGAFRTR